MSRIAELSSSCLVIHSERLIDQLRPLLRRLPIAVVPHGAEMAQSPIPVPDKRRLLIFGRLLEYKGVDTALEAFRRLPASLSDAELVVAGRGPLAARARGMQNVQVREEYIADSELDDLLGEARLVLLAYKDATQSGVGLQAVARGVPCVVSSAGALPELVENLASGLVVSPESPAQLAQAIVNNIDHGADLRLATYSHAADNFAWPVVAVRLRSELSRLGLIDRAVTDPPASAVAR
jgi:glycosyltransferase involved in cell wall biosynthesis